MARTQRRQYDPTTPEAVKALLAYHNQTLAHLKDLTVPGPDPAILTLGLPQGSITKAEVVEEGGIVSIAFTIKDRPPRLTAPDAFYMMRVLVAFETGGLFLDKSSAIEEKRMDYLEAFADPGITVQRLIANAQAGEQVRLRRHHHDLRPEALEIINGPAKIGRGRREAIAAALKAFDRNAVGWGLSGILSRSDYQMMLRGAFTLCDAQHGHHFLRPIGN